MKNYYLNKFKLCKMTRVTINKLIINILLLLLLLISINTDKYIKISSPVKGINVNNIDILYKGNYKDSITKFIIKHEGLSLTSYRCEAGYNTIGYGHVIYDTLNHTITLNQADSLLNSDILKAQKCFECNLSPEIQKSLKPWEKWVLIHFIYCKGIGNFNKSKIPLLLSTGENIDNELLKWTKHTKNDNLIHSDYSYRIRLVELRLYNTGKLLIYKNFKQ